MGRDAQCRAQPCSVSRRAAPRRTRGMCLHLLPASPAGKVGPADDFLAQCRPLSHASSRGPTQTSPNPSSCDTLPPPPPPPASRFCPNVRAVPTTLLPVHHRASSAPRAPSLSMVEHPRHKCSTASPSPRRVRGRPSLPWTDPLVSLNVGLTRSLVPEYSFPIKETTFPLNRKSFKL